MKFNHLNDRTRLRLSESDAISKVYKTEIKIDFLD